MENKAIVIGCENGGFPLSGSGSVFSCLSAFRLGGYSFSEVRFLPFLDGAISALSELNSQAENLVVITERALSSRLSEELVKMLSLPFTQATVSGTGMFTAEGKTVFLLVADDPSAGEEYVKNACIPHLDRKYGRRCSRMTIRAVGAEKSQVDRLLETALRMSGDRLTYFLKTENDESIIEIVYDSTVPKMLADDVLRLFLEGLGDSVYALDDTPLERQLVNLLKLRGKKISVSESFTGGGIARRIVSVSGASEVYFEGLNTYAERAKSRRLGVSEYTLKTYGAVSDETAYEMAAGLLATGDCDISIATTGIAGPKSDRSELPVGLSYIAVGFREKIYVYRHRFDGTREEITEKAINHALMSAYRLLKNM